MSLDYSVIQCLLSLCSTVMCFVLGLSASALPLCTPDASLLPSTTKAIGEGVAGGCSAMDGAVCKDSAHSPDRSSRHDSTDIHWARSIFDAVKQVPLSKQSMVDHTSCTKLAILAPLLDQTHSDVLGEDDEFDLSLQNVQLGDDDLRELDADVDFSDLEDQLSTGNDALSGGARGSGGESGDKDFDFDEPMFGLPGRDQLESHVGKTICSPSQMNVNNDLHRPECNVVRAHGNTVSLPSVPAKQTAVHASAGRRMGDNLAHPFL